jgi:hypothetical protein
MNNFLGQKMSENSHKICKHVNMELYIICQLSSNRKVMIHISRFYFLFCVRIKLNQIGILLKNLKKHKSSMLTHYCITLWGYKFTLRKYNINNGVALVASAIRKYALSVTSRHLFSTPIISPSHLSNVKTQCDWLKLKDSTLLFLNNAKSRG